MPVQLSDKLTLVQRQWIRDFYRETTFEVMHKEELRNGTMTFEEVARKNIEWFENWTRDVMGRISRVPGTET